jgi:hypothetical protein
MPRASILTVTEHKRLDDSDTPPESPKANEEGSRSPLDTLSRSPQANLRSPQANLKDGPSLLARVHISRAPAATFIAQPSTQDAAVSAHTRASTASAAPGLCVGGLRGQDRDRRRMGPTSLEPSAAVRCALETLQRIHPRLERCLEAPAACRYALFDRLLPWPGKEETQTARAASLEPGPGGAAAPRP